MSISKTLIKSLLIGMTYTNICFAGVVDGGGGEIGTSSISAVRGAIAAVLQEFRLEDQERNPAKNLYQVLLVQDESKNAEVRRLSEIFDNPFQFARKEKESELGRRLTYAESRALQLEHPALFEEGMKWLRFRIEEEKPCYDSEGAEKDASVSEFSWQATICISAYRLSRLPEHVLFQSIGPLMLHEFAHVVGANEASAEALQKFAIQNYGQVFFRSKYSVFEIMHGRLMTAFAELNNSVLGLRSRQLSILAAVKSVSYAQGTIDFLVAFLGHQDAVLSPERPELREEALEGMRNFAFEAFKIEKLISGNPTDEELEIALTELNSFFIKHKEVFELFLYGKSRLEWISEGI